MKRASVAYSGSGASGDDDREAVIAEHKRIAWQAVVGKGPLPPDDIIKANDRNSFMVFRIVG